MTTHTLSTTPRLSIFPSHRLNPISRLIYSGFVEHMGRCIYGGLYDPSNPNSDLTDPTTGFRTDVISALQELNIPCFRYPGGNFCATYHWQDGIGPVSSRPARNDLAWSSKEPNLIGTDEFMHWCKDIMKAEPYLCLNFGTGTLDEALGWVEYCNGTNDTYYANLRRKNGHEEPYNVKYWALGNEMWGDWQVCQMSDSAYADKAWQWAKALKLLDPSIKLVLCGKEGGNSWDHNVLKYCLRERPKADLGSQRPPLIDMHSIHMYTASRNHYENVIAPLCAERAIETTSSLIDLCFYDSRIPSTEPRPKVCFDEWNVWLPSRAPGVLGAEENYTLSDALAVGVWLNVLVRKSADLGMANIAQSVNVLSPLMTSKEGITKQTIWWPYELFCKYMKGDLIAVHLACELYDGPAEMAEEWGRSDFVRAIGRKTAWLDVSATRDDEGMVSVCVVNMHLEKDMDTEMEGVTGEVQVFTVKGAKWDVTNMKGKQEVCMEESEWDGKGSFAFPRCSITMLRWKVA